ncbi:MULTISPECIES: ABC transporter permease [Caproicibacterium]|uniref:ABC transporter permease subunit n=1 Tax=Caproicibacterium argilliputei TaxID=3030016 RepID=A0AA97D8X7_9FIRM|nr:ABC transporter permease subunit [Caproicibacterium argilliputei]WOC31642.1 ABC transporter permease subunit [Caproicibacterium argilliputei]
MKRTFFQNVSKYKVLLLMLLPATIYVLIFSYLPMGGIILAFKNYNYADGIFGSPWCGLDNFNFFFSSGQAFKVTRNTLVYNLLFIAINLVMQVGVAVLLSELRGKYYKKFAQSVMFLPYFISWVIVSVIAFNFFSYDYGAINKLLTAMGKSRVDFYQTTWVWMPILIFFNTWKNIGYGTVMYLAAIMGIDTSTYEAADIDGANVFQRIFHITIPALMPTIVILLLLSVGGIFRGNFDMFYQLVGSNGNLYDTTDVIDTFTFRALISNNDVGMAAASGLYQSVFCLVAILITNYCVKRYDPDYSLF